MNHTQKTALPSGATVDHSSTRALARWPTSTLTALLVLTAAFLGWACFTFFTFDAATTDRRERVHELEQLRASIRYLDEVLTNSALMAAETGDASWEKRYHDHEPELDAAIKRAMTIAQHSTAVAAVDRIDAANLALVAIENQAFELVRAGQREDALVLLKSPAYAAHKLTYAEGTTALAASLTLAITHLQDDHTREVASTTVIGAIMLVALLMGWGFNARAVRIWTRQAQAATDELARQKQDMASVHMVEREAANTKLVATNHTLQAEVAARAGKQTELDELFAASLDLLTLGSLDGRILRANPSFCSAFGYSAADLVGQPFSNIVPQEDRPALVKQLARVAAGETLTGIVTPIQSKDGRVRQTQWNLVPFVERGIFYATGRDITERRELEESLRKALAAMHDAQRIGTVGSWSFDLSSRASEWSEEMRRIFGLTPGEAHPHVDEFTSIIHPDDRKAIQEAIEELPTIGGQRRLEYRIVRRDGQVRNVVARMEAVPAPDGKLIGHRGTCQDITEQRTAEAIQAKLQEQLRAAQKMEAVGSLAGGIAHDFNNLLSVILGYAGFVLKALDHGDSRRLDVLEIQKAAERAAALTRQLLAFGRKQVLRPVPLDLNSVAAGMEGMLRRIIGEDIRMVQKLDPQLGLTLADPGQIEQVTMNLVANARDAMPTGGRLTIETANVTIEQDQGVTGLKPGPYVMLAVSDTGTGMDKATQARLFEPFFTTKPVGKGTGLGLPMVYGIVKQSGGNVTVYSEPGVGSTFRVYLPRDASALRPAEKRVTRPLNLLGSETILLVEDEPAVRSSADRMLSSVGYSVLTAGNGEDGVAVCETFAGRIDLLLTDVVMPKMSGVELARQVARLRPDTRIVFMSGYSDEAVAHPGMLEPGTQFISKPFSSEDLARKVREVLDGERDVYSTDPTDLAPTQTEAQP